MHQRLGPVPVLGDVLGRVLGRISGWLSGLALAVYPGAVSAQITADGTIGTQVNGSSIAPCSTVCQITGGTAHGVNLYHSFQAFSIATGGAVGFNHDPSIQTIFARVTGPMSSMIDGSIGTTGTTSLFLINPNGILFGPQASLTIGGSFLATTAASFRFADGSDFSAVAPLAPPLLNLDITPGLQLSQQSGSITNYGNLTAGKDLILDGRQLNLQGKLVADRDLVLTASNVKIREGIASPFLAKADRNLTIQGNQSIDILALSHPDAAIQSGGTLGLISDGAISADARIVSNGSFSILDLQDNAGQLVSRYNPIIRVNGDVLLGDYTGVSLKVEAAGDIQIGDIGITGPNLGLTGTDSESLMLSQGSALILRAGAAFPTNSSSSMGPGQLKLKSARQSSKEELTVSLSTKDNLTLNTLPDDIQQSMIVTSGGDISISAGGTFRNENALLNTKCSFDNCDKDRESGNINILAKSVELNSIAELNAGSVSAFNGGNITIVADQIAISGSLLFSSSDGAGDAGTITIQGNQVDLLNSTRLFAGSAGSGYGGTISITATDRLTLAGTDSIGEDSSRILTDISGSGDGGDILITTQDLIVQDGGLIASTVDIGGTGRSGNVVINADRISVSGTNVDANPSAPELKPSRIATASVWSGDAGNLTLNSRILNVSSGGLITTATLSPLANAGDGGSLTLNIRESITLDGSSPTGPRLTGISSDTFGPGRAGLLQLNSSQLTILSGASVSASTYGPSPGGELEVNVRDRITLKGTGPRGFAGGLQSQSFNMGNAGNIQVTTGQLTIDDGAAITVASGNLTAAKVPLDQLVFLIVPPYDGPFGNAGSLVVKADRIALTNQGKLSATSASGEGGNLNLTASQVLSLRGNSQISATAGDDQSSGNGGNITLKSPFILSIPDENSDITANAFKGKGGTITIQTQGLLGIQIQPALTDRSDITASSKFGQQGLITTTNPNIDPSRGISQLPTTTVIPHPTQGCQTNSSGTQAEFFTSGRGGQRQTPEDPLSAMEILDDLRIPDTINPSVPRQAILEATHWTIGPSGQINIVANANPNLPTPHCRLYDQGQ
jgi:filamentous hemagglutinin family protein